MGRYRLVGAAALPLILVLAACGGGATPTPSAASPSTAAASPSSAAASPSSAAASPTGSASAEAEYEIKVAAGSGSVTNYLTGEDGKTLYAFQKDTAGKSVCNGDCAAAWPPFAADSLDEVKADDGVTGTLSLITRDDGSKQIAYNGKPLYYFGGDSKAGDTNGATIPSWGVAHP